MRTIARPDAIVSWHEVEEISEFRCCVGLMTSGATRTLVARRFCWKPHERKRKSIDKPTDRWTYVCTDGRSSGIVRDDAAVEVHTNIHMYSYTYIYIYVLCVVYVCVCG